MLKKRSSNLFQDPVFWLWLAVAAYIVLIATTLKVRTFDGDEGVILNVVQAHGWQQFWARIAADVHPPLYHILAKISSLLFGAGEFSLRLPAAIAGLLLLPAGFWLGKTLWSERSKAVVLAIMLSFSPYLFYFHEEARFYSLFLLGAVLTYAALANLLKKQTLGSWLLFLLGALVLVWTQYLGWFVLAAEFVAVLVAKDWKVTKRGILVLIFLVATYVPFYSIASNQFSGRLSEQGGLFLKDNIIGILNAAYRFGADRLLLGVEPNEIIHAGVWKILLFIVSLATPWLIIIFGIQKNKKTAWRLMTQVVIGLSLLLALFVSEVGGRSARYLIYLWPFFGVWLVNGFWALRPKLWGKALIIAFILLSVAGIAKHVVVENKAVGEKDVAAFLNENGSRGDAVLVKGALAGGEKAALSYYYNGPVVIVDYYAKYEPGSLKNQQPSASSFIASQVKNHSRVWYFDLTYGTLEEGMAPRQSYILGSDKEEMPLTLYRFEVNNAK